MAIESISENLSTFTRRAILAGLPVIVTASAFPVLAANSPAGADAELLTMIQQWHALCDETNRLAASAARGPAVDAELERRAAVCNELWDRIIATRATTPAAMLAKLDAFPDDSSCSRRPPVCMTICASSAALKHLRRWRAER